MRSVGLEVWRGNFFRFWEDKWEALEMGQLLGCLEFVHIRGVGDDRRVWKGMSMKGFLKKKKTVLCKTMLKVPDHQVVGHQAGNGRLRPLVDDWGRFYKPLQGDEHGSNEIWIKHESDGIWR
ncbi:hypothetical protein ACS0TY_017055 [Phlomoides rotata]